MGRTVQTRLNRQADATPGRPALGWCDGSGEISWQTYEQLFGRALGSAAWLAERGVEKGDVCLLVLPSEEQAAVLLLGTLLRGAIPLLMAPPTLQGEPESRLRAVNRVITKTEASLVLMDGSMRGARDRISGRPDRKEFLDRDESVPTSTTLPDSDWATREDDIAAFQLTSGTTGFPRVCVWEQRSVVAALDGMAQAMDLCDQDICVNWTPLYHDMGLVNNFLLCLTHGVPLLMLRPRDFVRTPSLWLRALDESRATITWSPNFGFAITAERVHDDEITGIRLDTVRAFWNAAERIHLQTIQTFHERFAPYGVRYAALKTNFGCAENVGGATFSDPEGEFVVERVDAVGLQEERIARRIEEEQDADQVVTIVGVGRPCPGIEVEILSETGQPLPEGHVGELALDTPSRMVGYLGDPEATQRGLCGPLLRTGDLGYVRNGELFWVGRVEERITVHGRKIDPSDFEPILFDVDGLRKGCFVAFGIDDPKLGTQRVVIVSELRNHAETRREDIAGEIREQVLTTLGIAVHEVLLVPPGTLAKTSSGKRRHRHFRELYLAGELGDRVPSH